MIHALLLAASVLVQDSAVTDHAHPAPRGASTPPEFPAPKDAHEPTVSDIAPPVFPSLVKLGGDLGARYQASITKRLLEVNENELLAGFETRPGSQAWIGEHIGKWMHAAVLCQVATGDAALGAKIDRVRERLCATQGDDGYLGTYVKEQRFGNSEGADWDVWVHKYVLIGLVTDWRYRGTPQSLMAARRVGDLLCDTFAATGGKDLVAAGTHVGMAATSVLEPMVLLYRATGEDRYLGFCHRLIERMGKPGGPDVYGAFLIGWTANAIANGKAYEMLSNVVGLCEMYRETGKAELLAAAENAWQDIATHRLYPTGSGSSGEYWLADGVFPLGADAHVAETCVTVTWLQLSLQLHALTGEARYAEAAVRTIRNHLLAAQEPGGADWCYFTPLAGMKEYRSDVNCCHSSGPRGLALIPGFVFASDGEHLRIEMLTEATATIPMRGKDGHLEAVGIAVSRVEGANGTYSIALDSGESRESRELEIMIRVPPAVGPAAKCSVLDASGASVASVPMPAGDYAKIRRVFAPGDTITVSCDPQTVWVDGAAYGNPGTVYATHGVQVLTFGAGAFAPADTKAVDAPPQRFQPTTHRFEAMTGDAAKGIPFADVTTKDGPYAVFLPRAPDPATLSLAAFGSESWSRPGNVGGSITDCDAATYRVTWDGVNGGAGAGVKSDANGDDWFAVSFAAPTPVARVVFRHGRSFHDGGWFDASNAKPRVQVLMAEGGEWTDVETLANYPATTATGSSGLSDGQAFELKFAARNVIGVRVAGKPASGDVPTQAFASCAELEAWGS